MQPFPWGLTCRSFLWSRQWPRGIHRNGKNNAKHHDPDQGYNWPSRLNHSLGTFWPARLRDSRRWGCGGVRSSKSNTHTEATCWRGDYHLPLTTEKYMIPTSERRLRVRILGPFNSRKPLCVDSPSLSSVTSGRFSEAIAGAGLLSSSIPKTGTLDTLPLDPGLARHGTGTPLRWKDPLRLSMPATGSSDTQSYTVNLQETSW